MKPFLNSLKSDILFQFNQGFYLIYFVVAILYICLLSLLPKNWIPYTLPFLLFSDPSVLGLFFIGGILLLEKEQGILSLLSITPLSVDHYLLSKLISLGTLSVFVSIGIFALSYGQGNYFLLIIGVFSASILFTLLGIWIVSFSSSLNSFFLNMIPITLVGMVPCFFLYSPYSSFWLNFFPSVAAFRLILGSVSPISQTEILFCITWIFIINFILFLEIKKSFQTKILEKE